MKSSRIGCFVLALCTLGNSGRAEAQTSRALRVHLTQANNNSPYAFVRATFNPCEVSDPWAVRFINDQGKEVPFFVWDSINWRVARDGRVDWGKRYALLNHGPGDAAAVVEARGQKIQWAKKNLPALGTTLLAREQAAQNGPDSVCAALYLLRHKVPPFGKERLTLRIDADKKIEPKRQAWNGSALKQGFVVKQGRLEFRHLPDRLGILWDGKEVMCHAGFQAGGQSNPASHADPSRPFAVEVTEGIITKLSITAQTKGRHDGVMDWQCCYWLLPEGAFVALEGFRSRFITD